MADVEHQLRLLGVEVLAHLRLRPALLAPRQRDLRHARPRAVAEADELEHLLQAWVPGVARVAPHRHGPRDAQQPGVDEHERPAPLEHANAARTGVVRVDEGVDQGLAQRLVGGRRVDALHVGRELERHLQVCDQLRLHAQEEREHVAGPLPVYRDAVDPPQVGASLIDLSVVKLIPWKPVKDGALAAEHQQARNRRPLLPTLRVRPPRADAPQHGAHVALKKRMPRLHCAEQVAPHVDGVAVQRVESVALDDRAVARHVARVGDHPAHLGLRTAPVALAGPPKRVHGVAAEKHGLRRAVRARDPDHEHVAIPEPFRRDVTAGEHVDADLLPVVEQVPQLLLDTPEVRDPYDLEAAVRSLGEAKHDDPTIRVRHRRVCLEERRWHRPTAIATRGELRLEVPPLAELFELLQRHGVSTSAISSTAAARVGSSLHGTPVSNTRGYTCRSFVHNVAK